MARAMAFPCPPASNTSLRPCRTQGGEGSSGPSSLVAHRMPTRCDKRMNRRLRIRRQESLWATVAYDRSRALRRRRPGGCTSGMHSARPLAIGGARSGGRFLLRIEDLDQARSRPEFVDGIYEDLRLARPRLGRAGAGAVAAQRRSTPTRCERLRERGLVYPCFCTRADIAAALTAPHGAAAGIIRAPAARCPTIRPRRATTPHSWRLDSAKAIALAGLPSWTRGRDASFDASAGRHRRRHPRPQGRPRAAITWPAWSTMRRAG